MCVCVCVCMYWITLNPRTDASRYFFAKDTNPNT